MVDSLTLGLAIGCSLLVVVAIIVGGIILFRRRKELPKSQDPSGVEMYGVDTWRKETTHMNAPDVAGQDDSSDQVSARGKRVINGTISQMMRGSAEEQDQMRELQLQRQERAAEAARFQQQQDLSPRFLSPGEESSSHDSARIAGAQDMMKRNLQRLMDYSDS